MSNGLRVCKTFETRVGPLYVAISQAQYETAGADRIPVLGLNTETAAVTKETDGRLFPNYSLRTFPHLRFDWLFMIRDSIVPPDSCTSRSRL
jgi:hypothetical protein